MTPATCHRQFLRNPDICFLSLRYNWKILAPCALRFSNSVSTCVDRLRSSLYWNEFPSLFTDNISGWGVWPTYNHQACMHIHQQCLHEIYRLRLQAPGLDTTAVFCGGNKTVYANVCRFRAEGAEQHGAQRDGEGWAQHQNFCGELCLEAR